jgi:transcriptional regulator GlxA family with amidase domain
LADTHIPLAQLAIKTGFCDQSHLTRVFRSVTGTTPSVYRRVSCASRPRLR